MPLRFSTFAKFNFILIGILLPLLALNFYTNQTSNTVVRKEILKSSSSNMQLLTNQMDTMVDQLSTFALIMERDSAVRSYLNYEEVHFPYDKFLIVSNIQEKLKLNSSSMAWDNQIAVYSPSAKEAISNTGNIAYNESFLQKHLSTEWTYTSPDYRYGSSPYFLRYFVEPNLMENKAVSSYRLLTEISFPTQNIIKMLDTFKSNGSIHDPFLFKPGIAPIMNSYSEKPQIAILLRHLNESKLKESGNETVQMNGKKYIVTYQLSHSLNWYLVDFLPLNDVLAPISRSSKIFMVSLAILIGLALTLSFLIYRNVQKPILKLVSSVRSITRGDYNVQITYTPKNEFQFLINQFNTMAHQIKELIETVYESRIRLQEATLKHLQSQIDPHFLYNSLNFIQYSAKMGNEAAVISMTLNLGAYYRYATRLENPTSTLQEELELIRNYLEIHKLRMHKMNYEIDCSDNMRALEVPRLILQPLVENAIIHGLAPLSQAGWIRVNGCQEDGFYRLSVEDNGVGLALDKRAALLHRIMKASNEDNLCGLWNVAQRLLLHYGPDARIEMEEAALGGLKISLIWPIKNMEG
ncbi:two-component system, sensor histidine kinase YesM [Paenibacillus catalpae]|uniref:Two-component system, sensor histidine kinase YesM n=1 Tax=Paenibacillus catalpae TaxID=1045775 RepID=A0A1I1TY79_9BACL|nr:sensor histidine kinase [Paenibacillus catalpae]SFD63601.1 two-component system, sensor histidine kinase YesM [Paenibacillus catalpae]